MISKEDLAELIEVARGERLGDTLLTNGRLINVFNEEIEKKNVLIHKGRIAGVGDYESAKEVIDVDGAFISPSFIDSHLHIESTMLIPPEFAKAVLPLGTTTVVADPHEIANVAGIPGIQFMLNSSKNLPVDIYFLLSSCVPATSFETSGAHLYAEDLQILKGNERVLGLAELMNYPGVLHRSPEVMDKVSLFYDTIIDGHSPGLSGNDLNAYLTAGVMADHECTTPEEALEKLSKGMYIMMREGSVTRDVLRLMPIISDKTKHRIMLCSDDKHPEDLLFEGNINYAIHLLEKNNIPLPVAVRLATLNPSSFFGFRRKGGIAPGFVADIAIFDDVLKIQSVLKNGRQVAKEGRAFFNTDVAFHEDAVKNTINLKQATFDKLIVKAKGNKMRVIKTIPDSVLTDELIVEPKVVEGNAVSDTQRDVIKIAVFERHHATGNVMCGFINGIGIKNGAFATSIAHDSHNIIAAGVNDADILLAVAQLEAMGGGIAITKDGKVLASLALPYGGLMTNRPLEEVADSLKELHSLVKQENKATISDPFMTLAFMALPVIPKLKITDKGLVDVDKFEFVPLFLEE
ncbi:MAG: adenine deaminase [Caldisericaceae bacterium]